MFTLRFSTHQWLPQFFQNFSSFQHWYQISNFNDHTSASKDHPQYTLRNFTHDGPHWMLSMVHQGVMQNRERSNTDTPGPNESICPSMSTSPAQDELEFRQQSRIQLVRNELITVHSTSSPVDIYSLIWISKNMLIWPLMESDFLGWEPPQPCQVEHVLHWFYWIIHDTLPTLGAKCHRLWELLVLSCICVKHVQNNYDIGNFDWQGF